MKQVTLFVLSFAMLSSTLALASNDDGLKDYGRWIAVPLKIYPFPDVEIVTKKMCIDGYLMHVLYMVNTKNFKTKVVRIQAFEKDTEGLFPMRRVLC